MKDQRDLQRGEALGSALVNAYVTRDRARRRIDQALEVSPSPDVYQLHAFYVGLARGGARACAKAWSVWLDTLTEQAIEAGRFGDVGLGAAALRAFYLGVTQNIGTVYEMVAWYYLTRHVASALADRVRGEPEIMRQLKADELSQTLIERVARSPHVWVRRELRERIGHYIGTQSPITTSLASIEHGDILHAGVIYEHHPEIIHQALESGADHDHGARNKWGDTALHICAREGSAELIHAFIAQGQGVDVERRNVNDTTPLMEASRVGRIDTAKALLAGGAEVNHINPKGRTALSIAVMFGQSETIEFLLDHGADPLPEYLSEDGDNLLLICMLRMEVAFVRDEGNAKNLAMLERLLRARTHVGIYDTAQARACAKEGVHDDAVKIMRAHERGGRPW